MHQGVAHGSSLLATAWALHESSVEMAKASDADRDSDYQDRNRPFLAKRLAKRLKVGTVRFCLPALLLLVNIGETSRACPRCCLLQDLHPPLEAEHLRAAAAEVAQGLATSGDGVPIEESAAAALLTSALEAVATEIVGEVQAGALPPWASLDTAGLESILAGSAGEDGDGGAAGNGGSDRILAVAKAAYGYKKATQAKDDKLEALTAEKNALFARSNNKLLS